MAVFFLIFGLFLSQASGSDMERMYLSEWLDSIQVFVFLHFLVQGGGFVFFLFCFLSCDPTLCSGRGAGDYLLLEQVGAWTASSLYICVRARVGACMCAGV